MALIMISPQFRLTSGSLRGFLHRAKGFQEEKLSGLPAGVLPACQYHSAGEQKYWR